MREKCAVFGAYQIGPNSIESAITALSTLQHRGEDSSGIAFIQDNQQHFHKAAGLVSAVFENITKTPEPPEIIIGHNRYATSGGINDNHIQPIGHPESQLALAHNGNLPSTIKLAQFLDKVGIRAQQLNDSGMMHAAIDYYLKRGADLTSAIYETYPLFTGAFTVVASTSNEVAFFKDRCGIRPGTIAHLNGGEIYASETAAAKALSAQSWTELGAGQLHINGKYGRHDYQLTKADPKLDIFEIVYFARPDSVLQGRLVAGMRQSSGQQLAIEQPTPTADIVVPLPESAQYAAQGYSRQSGIPIERAIYKPSYARRSFIQQDHESRINAIKTKFSAMEEMFNGQSVVLIDDSVVRGNTTKQAIELVRQAGAKEVHIRIASAPYKYPDFYGIDTPTQAELLAANMDHDQMTKFIGADSLGFLSEIGLYQAYGQSADSLSAPCFNGRYPIDIGERQRELVLTH